MGAGTVLETDVFNHEPGHAAKHNATNDQVNWLTTAWAGRAADATLHTDPLFTGSLRVTDRLSLTKRVLNGDDNVLLGLGTAQAVTDQVNDTYMVTITPTGAGNFINTTGVGARAIGFNIGQWRVVATDGAANLTRTGEFANIEHDFIQFEQVGGTAIFNKVVSSRFRFAIPKAGVTIVDNKGIDFVVPLAGDVTGAVTNYVAINIPALAGGGGANHYGIRFNNAPNGGSIVAVNNDLVLRALTAGQGIVLATNFAVPGAVGALRIDGGLAGAVALRLAFGGSGTGHKFSIAKDVAGVKTDLVTIADNGNGVVACLGNVTIAGTVVTQSTIAAAGQISSSFAVATTAGGNITSDAQLKSKTGFAAWNHAVPGAQPAAPATLADVIAILQGCGLCA